MMKSGFLFALLSVLQLSAHAADFRSTGREGFTIKRPTYSAVTINEAYFEPNAPGPYEVVFKFEEAGEVCLGMIRISWVMRTRVDNRATGNTVSMHCPSGYSFEGLTGTPVSSDGLGGLSLVCLRSSPQGCMNAILKANTPFILAMSRNSQ